MCKQFLCVIARGLERIEHRVNCNNKISAINICEALFPDAWIVGLTEVG